MLQLSTKDIPTLIGQIAAVLVALGVIWKALGPVIALWKRLIKLFSQVEALTAEFQVNGGLSIRDSLNRIEKNISKQDDRQRILLDLTSYAIIELSQQGRLSYANRSFLRWTDRALNEVIGDGWINVVEDSDREWVKREWENAISEKRAFESAFFMKTSSGYKFRVALKTYPMEHIKADRSVDVVGWIGIINRCEHEGDCTIDLATCSVIGCMWKGHNTNAI